MIYNEFLKKYNYPKLVTDIHDRKIDVSAYIDEFELEYDFDFPPILIPFIAVRTWPGYVCVVVNPFDKDSKLSFIEYSLEGNDFEEVAKNTSQFKTWMLYDAYMNIPEVEDAEILAEKVGFCKADELEGTFEGIDTVNQLKDLAVFKSDLPARLDKKNEYKGKPFWLVEKLDIDNIYKLIDRGELKKAWLSLNSNHDLSQKQVLKALKLIASKLSSKNEMFDDLITCWENVNLKMGNLY